MRSITRGAVAVALTAVLASCSEGTPSGADPEARESATDTPITEPAACQTLAGSGDQTLTPGCWAIQSAALSGGPRAELELPAGFNGSDFGVWVNPNRPEEWGTIALRMSGDVYPDPCTRAGNPPTLGPAVEDFTTALGAQKVTETTAPVPVEVDGHAGLYVELSVPAAFDTSSCRDRELIVWQAPREETTGIDHEFVSRYWVLDVDGQRMVLVVNTRPKATEETVELFSRIVESATFTEG
jgi:hypothetical protein